MANADREGEKEENFRRVERQYGAFTSLVHSAQLGRSGASERRLQQGRAED